MRGECLKGSAEGGLFPLQIKNDTGYGNYNQVNTGKTLVVYTHDALACTGQFIRPFIHSAFLSSQQSCEIGAIIALFYTSRKA